MSDHAKTVELDADERRLLETYVGEQARIWDAAALLPAVIRLQKKGLIEQLGDSRASRITTAGLRALGHTTKVRDLKGGDIIDLLELGPDYPLSESVRSVLEYENAVVLDESDDETPWTVESAICWVLHTDRGSFRVNPDFEFVVQGRYWR